MPMLAHFEDRSRSGDRRGSGRRALRLDIAGAPASGGAHVTIHDLSLTGALLETSIALSVGEAFRVELPHTGTVEGIVVWNSGEFYGCQFKEPISPAALSAAMLQSAPRAAQDNAVSTPDLVAELRDINAQVEKIANTVERAVERLANKRSD
jgi:hypothetical protein